jgi:Mono-functional DNA-alkylating methyl methanesulfonate N-term
MSPRKLESILNWSPVMDQILVPAERHAPGNALVRDSINFTSGAQPFGALSELRIGLEALVFKETEILPFEQPEVLNAVTGLWVIADTESKNLHVFISLPGETVLFHIHERNPSTAKAEQLPGIFQGSGYEAAEESLLVSSTTDGRIIQVTPSSINLLGGLIYGQIKEEREEEGANDDETYTIGGNFKETLPMTLPEGASVILATFNADLSALVAALQIHDQSFLKVYDDLSAADTQQPFQISSYPTSISTYSSHSGLLIFIGTTGGTVQAYFYREGRFKHVGERPIPPQNGSEPVVEGIAVLSVQPPEHDSKQLLLLCGLRDGWLYAADIKADLGRDPAIGGFDLSPSISTAF